MKMTRILTAFGFLFISAAISQAEDEYYYGYGPYDHYSYDYQPYYNHGVYSSGYYYDPRAASHGSGEYGGGAHVPTGSVASPYSHGVHHGYHWSGEEGYHSGTHYGHE